MFPDSISHTPSCPTPPGSVPVSRRRSGTPGGASIDDNFLASMIFDTPPKPSSSSSGMLKSPHHKSTSALSDVQTSTPSSSKSHYKGKSHTLAVTESPSYLSSISVGYVDEFDQDLSPSSSIASGNASFVSNTPSTGVQHSRGAAGYSGGNTSRVSVGSSGGAFGNLDLAGEIIQQLGGRRVSSPTGSFNSPRKPEHPRQELSRHMDIPTSSSPITRYKRAASPTIVFPTDSQRQFVVTYEGHAPHPAHMSRQHDLRRSRSPDFPQRAVPYPSSYHPPSMIQQAHAQHKTVPQQHHQYGGVGGAPSGHTHHNQQQQQQHTVANHQHEGGGDPRSPGSATGQMRYASGSKTLPANASQSRIPPPGHEEGVAPGAPEQPKLVSRGTRKASDQEMGLLEVLNMWDKSNKSPFGSGDGTLV